MRSVFGFCCAAALLSVLPGCGEAPIQEIPVKGTVTLDGQPMPDGKVMFFSPGAPPRVMEIKQGAYSGKALPGKNRVELGSFKPGPPLSTSPDKPGPDRNVLPPQFNTASTLQADVSAGAANDFKFEATSQ